MVLLEGVRRTFRGPRRRRVVALEIDHLRVERGEQLAVLGPNGVGKTTLLHLVAGLLRPDEGEVVVDGQRLGRLTEARLDRFRARSVGYLLHGGRLLDGLSAEENVRAALHFAGVRGREQRTRAAAMLERFGVAHRAHHLPHALSAGEGQRVALARALANDPPLILADEPTSNLDGVAARHLVQELDTLCRDEGRTLVMVTHREDEVGAGATVLRLGAA